MLSARQGVVQGVVRDDAAELRLTVRRALHELAQPLSALECRLYLGTHASGAGPGSTAAEHRELRAAVAEAHRECGRLMEGFRALQQGLRDGA